jgi:hypothetical protein
MMDKITALEIAALEKRFGHATLHARPFSYSDKTYSADDLATAIEALEDIARLVPMRENAWLPEPVRTAREALRKMRGYV